MVFVLRDTEDNEQVGPTFQTGQEAGEAASRINDALRGAGWPNRVRVCREAAPASEAEEMAIIWGYEVPIAFDGGDYSPNARTVPKSGVEWRLREMDRAGRAEVPWVGEWWWRESPHWHMHFPHPALKDPAKVAFTESEEHGRADRQTVMRPGAYLQKYFSHLHAEDVKYWALQWANRFEPAELQFATTADEIQHVYENGPSSCMSYPASSFTGGIHPVRAYAGPDLQLAYIERSDGTIVGRAVVWPDKKQHSRIYGDIERMRAALHAAGYTKGLLEGARLTRIETEHGLHMPYLDGVNDADVEGDYVVIRQDGLLSCDYTDGVVTGPSCTFCEEPVRRGDDFTSHHFEGTACRDCYIERVHQCYHCGSECDAEESIAAPTGVYGIRNYCPSCAQRLLVTCAGCGKHFRRVDTNPDPVGNLRCVSCLADVAPTAPTPLEGGARALGDVFHFQVDRSGWHVINWVSDVLTPRAAPTDYTP